MTEYTIEQVRGAYMAWITMSLISGLLTMTVGWTNLFMYIATAFLLFLAYISNRLLNKMEAKVVDKRK